MPKLSAKLLPLFQDVWQRGSLPPTAIQDVELHIAEQALLALNGATHAVYSELLSFETTHRHIMVIACPDQAFYPDAVRAYLQKQGIQPLQQYSVLYPHQFLDKKDGHGLLLIFHFAAATLPSIQYVQQSVTHILQGVEASVTDFPDMLGTLENIAAHLAEDDAETADLLRWMLDDHYLLFGVFHVQTTCRNMGICRRKRLLSDIIPQALEALDGITTPKNAGMQWLHLGALFNHIYAHTNVRAVQLTWRERGKMRSLILLGHFSRSARYTNTTQLPVFRNAWLKMVEDAVLQQSAFYQREMRLLVDRAPKSLMHSIDSKQWLAPFKAKIDLHSPTEVVVARLQPKQGDVEYLLIAVNQHRFGDKICAKMLKSLAALGVQTAGYEGYVVGNTQLMFAAVSVEVWPHQRRLYHAIHACIIFWMDKAKAAILAENLPAERLPQALLSLSQVSHLYQDLFSPEQFVQDVLMCEKIGAKENIFIRLTAINNGEQKMVEVQVLSKHSMPLAQMTEQLNAFSLVTMEQALVPFGQGEQGIHICKFRCQAPKLLHHEGLPRLRQGIEGVFNQRVDHDPLNALVILCGLTIQDVQVVISLRNHLAQLMPSVSVGALSQILIKYRKVSVALFRMFEGKHRPNMPATLQVQAQADFEFAMREVRSLQEDTWLRALAELVQASLRTNVWQRQVGEALAIKVDTSGISFAPEPKPYREIFVHGRHVEGVHLRAGKIARGGLRYSDRPTDFRTEVLELMATQVVKNGQIVPTGAKGGFVIRDTDDVLNQYHQFIRALLSITDNRVAGKLMPPQGVKVADEDKDDAYLVVAADKGTARYSDDANAEALAANFWLGDAFASGGSFGYDHKAFGITAKGAWVAAAHHFARLGVDLWQDEVRVVGIGDMGGDVFGNGMLLNPNMQLVAAFNHQHIFLDPNPDVSAAFAERQRLFKAVLGWGEYDTQIISQGGGVFERNAKSIEVSAAMQGVLGITDAKLSGEALIRAILQAPVDLLYNGGIGTYVKASEETDADAQDPANNVVRIDAKSLRCQAVCEGGNLGFTQAARLEYAGRGGMINTDAIDNAAGVNMSDHEVNLKILLADVSFKQRNTWLKKAAKDVEAQCLSDNETQAIALSFAEETAAQHAPRLVYLQQTLLDEGYILQAEDDSVFALRPVLAEWLGYEKNRVHQALDDKQFYQQSTFGETYLHAYFPKVLRKKFQTQMQNHALAADIAHTRITSHLINRYGIVSIHYLENLTLESVPHIVQALLIADTLLGVDDLYQTTIQDAERGIGGWYEVQQDVLSFAEGLLALPDIMSVDVAWLARTQKTLQHYAGQQGRLTLMPLVTAIVLAEQTDKSLALCLQATADCLQVIPFAPLEAALRTPLWADNEAHALRREWLNRLRKLKIHAARLWVSRTSKQRHVLLAEWKRHPLQEDLSTLVQTIEGDAPISEEQQRLRYILALTHLQSIVECDCRLS